MKKPIATLLVFILLFTFAEASEPAVLMFASNYNLNAEALYGIPALSLDEYSSETDPNGRKVLVWNSNDIVIRIIVGQYSEAISATCRGDGTNADFIATCADLMYCICGMKTANYSQLLHVFFEARIKSGARTASLTTGGQVSMTSENGAYFFEVSK